MFLQNMLKYNIVHQKTSTRPAHAQNKSQNQNEDKTCEQSPNTGTEYKNCKSKQ